MATKKPESKQKETKTRTMREHAAKQRDKAEHPRRLKTATSTASKPFRALGHAVKTIFYPFRFLLRPFKTRPMRFIGRVIGKVLFLGYFKASWQELRKVTWPNAKMTAKLTVAVLLFATVFGLFIALVDYVLDKIFRSILL